MEAWPASINGKSSEWANRVITALSFLERLCTSTVVGNTLGGFAADNDDGGIIGGIGGMGGLGGLNAGFGSNGGLAAAAGELGMLFFNSPCKIFYSVNDSEWSDGVDINLMNQKRAPLNLVVTMPPEMPKLSKSPQASQHQANATTSLDPASEAAEQAPQTPDNPTITDSNPELHNAEDTH